ncbi:MAG: hypothetical protein WC308_00370 [archaeon]|jgi:ribosomal protein S18 acetylase RimI-like enzyme
MDFEFREATLKDVPAVIKYFEAVKDDFVPSLDKRGKSISKLVLEGFRSERGFFLAFARKPGGNELAALIGYKLKFSPQNLAMSPLLKKKLGSIEALGPYRKGAASEHGIISFLSVKKNYRESFGLGNLRKFERPILNKFRARGIKHVWIKTWGTNARALGLYKWVGFNEVTRHVHDRVDPLTGKPVDTVVMARELKPLERAPASRSRLTTPMGVARKRQARRLVPV